MLCKPRGAGLTYPTMTTRCESRITFIIVHKTGFYAVLLNLCKNTVTPQPSNLSKSGPGLALTVPSQYVRDRVRLKTKIRFVRRFVTGQ